jgi:hypothetical protein
MDVSVVRPDPPLAPRRLSRRTEVELLAPLPVALSSDQRQEAVGLFAELLLDAARKRDRVRSGSGFDGVIGGASGGVPPLPDEGARARSAAC